MAMSVGQAEAAVSTSLTQGLWPTWLAPRVTLSLSLSIHLLQVLIQSLDLGTQAGHSGFQLQLLTDLVGSGRGSEG